MLYHYNNPFIRAVHTATDNLLTIINSVYSNLLHNLLIIGVCRMKELFIKYLDLNVYSMAIVVLLIRL